MVLTLSLFLTEYQWLLRQGKGKGTKGDLKDSQVIFFHPSTLRMVRHGAKQAEKPKFGNCRMKMANDHG